MENSFYHAELELENEPNKSIRKTNIDIRIQKRNNKKYITTVSGLNDLQIKDCLKILPSKLCCNGFMNKDENFGNIITFSGDQRESIKSYLIDKLAIDKNQIKVHGF